MSSSVMQWEELYPLRQLPKQVQHLANTSDSSFFSFSFFFSSLKIFIYCIIFIFYLFTFDIWRGNSPTGTCTNVMGYNDVVKCKRCLLFNQVNNLCWIVELQEMLLFHGASVASQGAKAALGSTGVAGAVVRWLRTSLRVNFEGEFTFTLWFLQWLCRWYW